MSWRDDIQRVTLADGRRLIGASFRGVPFLVESSDRSGGRRTVTHEFPLRDDPYIEDLGRRARTFSIDGYVVGDDYIRQRDLLLAVLEDIDGPGELVHPYHGVRRAVCSGVTVRDSSRDGRMATLSIEFTEAPAQELSLSDAPDFTELVDESATAAMVALEAELVAGYDTDDLPSFAVASAADYLSDISDDLAEELSGVSMTTQELARLQYETTRLRAEATTLVRDPAETVLAFVRALDAVGEATVNEPLAFLEALVEVYDGAVVTLVAATTETRERERANQEALAGALRRILVVEAARRVPFVTFATLEDAIAIRDSIVERIDEQASTAGDAAYPALMDLRARVTSAVPGDAVLARVLTVRRRVAVPSLLLSYQLYGSVEQEADIVARNEAQHPGFMSGDLEVLSDV